MKLLSISIILLIASIPAFGQIAVKTNLLYDATTTPNIGMEVGVGGKSTINIVYGLNPWSFNSETHGKRFAKHWIVMPEYRWWPCTRFSGHFIGAHVFGGQMNSSKVDFPLPGFFFKGASLIKDSKDFRTQGEFIGAGITYGYQWLLSRHWNLEAEIGAGYGHVWYNRYPCGNCGDKISSERTNYAGITKGGLSIIYIF